MEGQENQGTDHHDREEIYANAVRAGKRTYFFDVRTTRGQDYYLTITESKRRYNEDGTYRYQKHKIFLYKEDFEKFSDALADAIKKVIELNSAKGAEISDRISDKFTDVNFDDLSTSDNGEVTAEATPEPTPETETETENTIKEQPQEETTTSENPIDAVEEELFADVDTSTDEGNEEDKQDA